jgi:uncharacterized MnhB-related membrane protein
MPPKRNRTPKNAIPKEKPDDPVDTFYEMISYINTHIINLNQSKVFAGIIIIILNISSKFATIKLGKSLEAYLKYTFSRSILIFAMAWMGTRDIYTAILITAIFGVCANFLFNEESAYCCLPESFTNYYDGIESSDGDSPPTQDEINRAIKVLSKIKE